MKTYLIICFVLLCSASALAQLNCLTGTKYTRISLPEGKTVFKKIIERRPRCMDCSQGVVYVDSLCKTVASFTIGIAPMAFVAEGYRLSDFAEGSNPVYKSAYERVQNRLSYNFNREKRFIVLHAEQDDFSFLQEGDSLCISNEKGLLHYRNGTLQNSYKIIPRQVIFTNNQVQQKILAYYLDVVKCLILIKDKYEQTALYMTREKVEESIQPGKFTEEDWKEAVRLKPAR